LIIVLSIAYKEKLPHGYDVGKVGILKRVPAAGVFTVPLVTPE